MHLELDALKKSEVAGETIVVKSRKRGLTITWAEISQRGAESSEQELGRNVSILWSWRNLNVGLFES